MRTAMLSAAVLAMSGTAMLPTQGRAGDFFVPPPNVYGAPPPAYVPPPTVNVIPPPAYGYATPPAGARPPYYPPPPYGRPPGVIAAPEGPAYVVPGPVYQPTDEYIAGPALVDSRRYYRECWWEFGARRCVLHHKALFW